nr:MAG TPA: hypothetical protein [Caudoviricetes sp.]
MRHGGSVGNRERSSGRRGDQKRKAGPAEGAPARIARRDRVGRKAAGDGDESAARLDDTRIKP